MYACIDLGSNSFHLLIGEWGKGRVQIIERLSEKVQLGENVHISGKISSQAFQRGLNCLQRFKLLMKQYPIKQYWALGTNTFRVTDNADDFIKEAKVLGIDISMVSGLQEAVLVYAGVITSLSENDTHRLVIDIGGGSTEIIIGKRTNLLFAESLPIGCVTWRDRFFSNTGHDQKELERKMDVAAAEARHVFKAAAPGISRIGWHKAYASSGTAKLLASICQEYGCSVGQIKLDTLHTLKHKIAECILEGRDLVGLKDRRRDLLLPGWSVMTALMESYKIDTMNFSATALREGMLDFMVKNEKTLKAMEENDLPEVSFAKG